MNKKLTMNEVILIIGFAFIVAGIALIHIPAAFIVCGSMLMYAGWPRGEGNGNGNDKQLT